MSPTRSGTLVGALILVCPFVQAFTMSVMTMSTNDKPKLWDMPVSNHGGRCRFVIYEKGLEDDIVIASPMDVGGLKSEEYLKMNPHGKMPCLSTPDCGSVPESYPICQYLMDKFEDRGSSLRPSTLQARMKSAAICRLFDTYIHPILGCMYKAVPPFGVHSDRLTALKDLQTQLTNLEELASAEGPFLAGKEVSLADATAWPTMIFVREMMPKFGRTDVLGPQLLAWCGHMERHPVGKRIAEEIKAPLDKWGSNGRWDDILHAGKRDTEPASIFDKILAKEIPSTVVFEDDRVLAFRDIAPVAPTHILIIPKNRNGLTQLRHATADHVGLLGYMLEVAAKIAKEEELEGFRLVVNDGAKGGQEVFHLHMHLIGGGKDMEKLGSMA
ncbi:unnamed protein product [Pylaiella littoralis]